VRDYVAVYERAQQQPHCLDKLEEEPARVHGLSAALKKGAKTA
jgi:hypothetical protein